MQALKISVIGAGAWGTALALSFTQEHEVTLLAIDAAEAGPLIGQRENVRFLPGIPLPESLHISHGADGLADADLILVVTPVAALREVVALLGRTAPGTPFLWACKGLEPGSSALAHQVVAEVRGEVTCGVLSGPSFAVEVAQGMPAAVCIASANAEFARRQAAQLSNQRLRIYASDDLVGVEVSGAVKNVLAIAAGISDGLGLGHNARAALLTRGLAEIARFGMALGARRETFMGLAGMGDVIPDLYRRSVTKSPGWPGAGQGAVTGGYRGQPRPRGRRRAYGCRGRPARNRAATGHADRAGRPGGA
jgi:glycerol-3-phosphate dehydrogenase (NAD(P)+)